MALTVSYVSTFQCCCSLEVGSGKLMKQNEDGSFYFDQDKVPP